MVIGVAALASAACAGEETRDRPTSIPPTADGLPAEHRGTPAFASDTTGWRARGATLARSRSRITRGHALQITGTAAGRTARAERRRLPGVWTMAGETITATAWVRARGAQQRVCLQIKERGGESVVGAGRVCRQASPAWTRFQVLHYRVRAGGHSLGVAVSSRANRPDARPRFVLDGISVRGERSRCSVYVAPRGTRAAGGRAPRTATSLLAAGDRAVPGAVVCLRGGTYPIRSDLLLSRSGTSAQPIVYRSYNGTPILKWVGPKPAPESSSAVLLADRHAHDLVFDGLTIDGANRASIGFKCNRGGYRMIVRNSTIRNTGSAGVDTKRCDYVTVEHNLISHTGYDPNVGWSSGISLNSQVWSDRQPGFHSFVVGNIVAGASDESSKHSEGHGIIVDLGDDAPPVLIANNVVYENGGSGINVHHAANVWAINNTCYGNGLDPRLGPGIGEITANGSESQNLQFANNVAFAKADRPPYEFDGGAQGVLSHDVAYGGDVSGGLQVRRFDPGFVDPPPLDLNRGLPQTRALPPWRIGSRLVPKRSSPLIDAGVDPRTLPGLTPPMLDAIDHYLGRDIRGLRRPEGRGWDVGAYEASGS